MLHHIERTIEPFFNILLSPLDLLYPLLGQFHEHFHVAEWGGFWESFQSSPKPYSANLCRAQELIRRCFRSPGSDCRRIEPFNDQPDRQNQLLHEDRRRQGNVAGDTVAAEQGQHARDRQGGDRGDTEA